MHIGNANDDVYDYLPKTIQKSYWWSKPELGHPCTRFTKFYKEQLEKTAIQYDYIIKEVANSKGYLKKQQKEREIRENERIKNYWHEKGKIVQSKEINSNRDYKNSQVNDEEMEDEEDFPKSYKIVIIVIILALVFGIIVYYLLNRLF